MRKVYADYFVAAAVNARFGNAVGLLDQVGDCVVSDFAQFVSVAVSVDRDAHDRHGVAVHLKD